ncbi:hypothetical protein MLD38_003356 [Melastoma candidum]|uniref:Uncharacterized protein n=1 Tax=Melastoma candidum TaxID=119954 RepID=A0ACB9S2J7_9MYRT|nr:hypothetical protein MLD38_003356 [Melastoma candidum]
MELPSTSSTKRARVPNIGVQVSSCLVDGCNSDLSKCRDYHRRHRVCELHSKTPKVTIRGQEQRFCQQCSKFHSLPEFDDEKRSCRKRLDGHNRRRRKPQAGALSLTAGSFLSGLQGSAFDPSSKLAANLPGHCSWWPESAEVVSDSSHYSGRHHQSLKFDDRNAVNMFPGSPFHDLQTLPRCPSAVGANSTGFMSPRSHPESCRQPPPTGINRAIASGLALSLLSPSTAGGAPIKSWSHPNPMLPEPFPSAHPWFSPRSHNHRNVAEKPSNPMPGLESGEDVIFQHQGLYHQDNADGICSSSYNNPTVSYPWE